jgi:HK97 family phage prohead protease
MTREDELRASAAQRSKAVVTRSDRPSERRSGEQPGTRAVMPARAKIEIRATSSADTKEFDGIASAYEAPYEMYDMFGPYNEIVTAGAGEESLARDDLDVPLVLQHQSLRRMARTTNGSLSLDENDVGLHVNAPELDMRDQDVAYIVPKLESQLIDEMSFAFRIEAGSWSPDYTEYRINKYDIHRGDVAIVGYGANPATSANLRAAVTILDKLKTQRALDAEDVNMLTQALGWLSAIDNIVDEGQEALAAYLQVPNPDADEALEQLQAMKPVHLRAIERALYTELDRRRMQRSMTLQDLLAVEI